MRAFIQSRNNMPGNINFFTAYMGFMEMGIECVLFQEIDELDECQPNDVVVGGLGTVKYVLGKQGIHPEELNYPSELQAFMGRRTRKSTIGRTIAEQSSWPVFVKPEQGKLFTGLKISTIEDLVGLGAFEEDPPVLCNKVVQFEAEWRCFVRYGEILDVRQYSGDWRKAFDPSVIEKAIAGYKTAPAAYAADFGITPNGETLLVEVNDGYALGSYGLQHNLYAKLLSARWAELTHTKDECDFR